MVKKKVAAFFDFDKTLLSVDSAEIGLKYLWKLGEISTGLILKIVLANELFKRHIYSAESISELALTLYKGKRLQDFEEGSREYYLTELKPFLAHNIVSRLEEHRRKGHLLVLLSASIRYMLEHVVQDLRFDHLLCTDLEVGSDNLLTGKARGKICIGGHKAVAAMRLADEQAIDLVHSYAYGDHYSDLPVLELVGNPFVVAPDTKLLQVASCRNWPIINH
ncbi:HAD family hydrolase [candidate division CSSED10-310 bacterium]|uniref:HAD family hydrolase n=1 Tax=candidate division CSSED10-310 bacterium TaxID=2855610 RepID=A0ABV6YTW0_UNCC1